MLGLKGWPLSQQKRVEALGRSAPRSPAASEAERMDPSAEHAGMTRPGQVRWKTVPRVLKKVK